MNVRLKIACTLLVCLTSTEGFSQDAGSGVDSQQPVSRPFGPAEESVQTRGGLILPSWFAEHVGLQDSVAEFPRFPADISAPATEIKSEARPVKGFRATVTRVAQAQPDAATPNSTIAAQDGNSASIPVPLPQPAPATMAVTESVVEVRTLVDQLRTQLGTAADLDDAVKADLQKRLDAAAMLLKSVDDSVTRVAGWEAEIESAPQTIEGIRLQLSAPLQEKFPEIVEQETLQETTQKATEAQTLVTTRAEELAARETDIKTRTDRRTDLPRLIAAMPEKVEALRKQLDAPAPQGENTLLTAARKVEARSQLLAAEQQQRSMQVEQRRIDVLAELTTLQRDLTQRLLNRAKRQVDAWQVVVADHRKKDIERQAREAREAAAEAHPSLRLTAERATALAERRAEVASLIEKVRKETEASDAVAKKVADAHTSILDKVRIGGGLSTTIGLVLRQKRTELPDLKRYRQRIHEIETELPRIQLERMELDEERSRLADPETAFDQLQAELAASDTVLPQSVTESLIRELLENRVRFIKSLIDDLDSYQSELTRLELSTRSVLTQTEEFTTYIDENVLWIRSNEVLGLSDLTSLASESLELMAWDDWVSMPGLIAESFVSQPLPSIGLGLLAFLILLSRRRAVKSIRRLGEEAAKPSSTSFRPTALAVLATFIAAAAWPAIIYVLTALHPAVTLSGQALTAAIRECALLLFLLDAVRLTCRSRGLAESHYGWRSQTISAIRRSVSILKLVALPMVFATVYVDTFFFGRPQDSLARLLFIASALLLALFAGRVLRPSQDIFRYYFEMADHGLIRRTRYLWYTLAVGAPIALCLLAIVGYFYTARQLAVRLEVSIWVLFGLAILQATAERFVRLARREAVMSQARERRAALAEQAAKEAELNAVAQSLAASPETASATDAPANPVPPVSSSSMSQTDLEQVDLSFLHIQVEKLISGAVFVSLLIGMWLTWVDVLPALRIADRVELWWTTVEVWPEPDPTMQETEGSLPIEPVLKRVPVTLTNLIGAVAVLALMVVATRNLPGFLELVILQRLPIDHGARHATTLVSRYSLTLAGIIIAAGMVGISWGSVQWLAAALTVGLGFGLQEIFANFVSGLIILFERPVRIGDVVTIDSVTGKVTRIRIRATTITDWDRKEYIVPNKEFVTGRLLNWTLSDPINRIVIDVGVAYGSDTEEARRLLLLVAAEHPLVLKEPEPVAVFNGFGDNSLNLNLRCFLPDLDNRLHSITQLHTAIDQAFKAASIEIAFPQRDLHLRTIDKHAAQAIRNAPPQESNPDAA